MLDANNSEMQTKSFWQRPEGTAGILALAGGGVGLYFALPALLAFASGLLALLGYTIGIVMLSLVLGAIIYVITNKKVQTLVSYLFKSMMRKLTGVFIELDPIGIMRNYIDTLNEKRAAIGKSRDQLRGQVKILEEKINKGEKEFSNAMGMAQEAKKRGNVSQLSINSRQAMRVEKLTKETYLPLHAQLSAHLKAANKYYEVTGIVIEDLKNEVQAQAERREMIKSSHSMMRAAKEIMHGGSDERQLYDQALEYVVHDYGMKLGEIESFIENTQPFIEGLDMQNGVYEAEALRRLDEWTSNTDSLLIDKRLMLEESNTVNLNAGVPFTQVADFESIIGRK